MSDYYYLSRNPSPDGDVVDFQLNRDDSPAYVSRRRYGNFMVSTSSVDRQQQSRCIYQNNQRLLTWDISLNDDQDEVSEHFLRMYYEPIIVTEKFGPDILMVPENIRKQADELFKPSEINPNEIFDLVNIKVSWILPSSYQQYLKSISKNETEKMERHVLYPWTQWENHGERLQQANSYRSASTAGPSSATSFDRSSLSSSLSLSLPSSSSPSSSSTSLYTLAATAYGRSPHSSYSNDSVNSNCNAPSFGSYGEASGLTADASPASESGCSFGTTAAAESPGLHWTAWPQQRQRQQQQQHQQQMEPDPRTAAAARSPSDRGRSVSSADLYGDDRVSPPLAYGTAAATTGPVLRRWPSRLFYCVSTDSNTINKLVEHYCTFCYKNQEPPEVYGSHLVRDATRTTCPKLRALRCKHCNGTGDNAHTIKYCPFVYANYS